MSVSNTPLIPLLLLPCEHLLTQYASVHGLTPGNPKYAALGLAAANPRVFWTLVEVWGGRAAARHGDIDDVVKSTATRLQLAASKALVRRFDFGWLFASLSGLEVDVTDEFVVQAVKAAALETAEPRHPLKAKSQPYLPLFFFLLADPTYSLSERLAFVVAKCALQRYNGKAYEEFSVAHLALLIESHASTVFFAFIF